MDAAINQYRVYRHGEKQVWGGKMKDSYICKSICGFVCSFIYSTNIFEMPSMNKSLYQTLWVITEKSDMGSGCRASTEKIRHVHNM